MQYILNLQLILIQKYTTNAGLTCIALCLSVWLLLVRLESNSYQRLLEVKHLCKAADSPCKLYLVKSCNARSRYDRWRDSRKWCIPAHALYMQGVLQGTKMKTVVPFQTKIFSLQPEHLHLLLQLLCG